MSINSAISSPSDGGFRQKYFKIYLMSIFAASCGLRSVNCATIYSVLVILQHALTHCSGLLSEQNRDSLTPLSASTYLLLSAVGEMPVSFFFSF